MWEQRRKKHGEDGGDDDLGIEDMSGKAPSIEDVMGDLEKAEQKASELEENIEGDLYYDDDCCICGC